MPVVVASVFALFLNHSCYCTFFLPHIDRCLYKSIALYLLLAENQALQELMINKLKSRKELVIQAVEVVSHSSDGD